MKVNCLLRDLRVLRGCILLLACCVTVNVAAQSPEVVTQIQVQGNTITPDAEMLDLAGLSVGMPLAPETIDSARRRLEATGRFDRVQVLKRFASIADPSSRAHHD
jgi:outer membrane protein assembly factor BamA